MAGGLIDLDHSTLSSEETKKRGKKKKTNDFSVCVNSERGVVEKVAI